MSKPADERANESAHVYCCYPADSSLAHVATEAQRLHQWAEDSPLWPYEHWQVELFHVVGTPVWMVLTIEERQAVRDDDWPGDPRTVVHRGSDRRRSSPTMTDQPEQPPCEDLESLLQRIRDQAPTTLTGVVAQRLQTDMVRMVQHFQAQGEDANPTGTLLTAAMFAIGAQLAALWDNALPGLTAPQLTAMLDGGPIVDTPAALEQAILDLLAQHPEGLLAERLADYLPRNITAGQLGSATSRLWDTGQITLTADRCAKLVQR